MPRVGSTYRSVWQKNLINFNFDLLTIEFNEQFTLNFQFGFEFKIMSRIPSIIFRAINWIISDFSFVGANAIVGVSLRCGLIVIHLRPTQFRRSKTNRKNHRRFQIDLILSLIGMQFARLILSSRLYSIQFHQIGFSLSFGLIFWRIFFPTANRKIVCSKVM